MKFIERYSDILVQNYLIFLIIENGSFLYVLYTKRVLLKEIGCLQVMNRKSNPIISNINDI